MDFLKEGVDFLADVMKTQVSRTITYKRLALSVSIEATVGRHPFAIKTSSGQMIEQVGRDYLFKSADLLLPALTKPERGDRIVDGSDEYEVMNPTPEEPEWRYNDSREVQIRVHTKQVK